MNERPCVLGRDYWSGAQRLGWLLVVVAVAVLLIVLVPATGSSSQSAASGALAFVSDRDGLASLYAINADGKGLRRLVPTRPSRGGRPMGSVFHLFAGVYCTCSR